MPLAGANFLAVLNGIATQRHSRTVSIACYALVLSQPFLYLGHDLGFRKELVRAALNISLRELDRPLKCLFFGKFAFWWH
jgi:hypothetical protein